MTQPTSIRLVTEADLAAALDGGAIGASELALKADLASPSFTGWVAGITPAMVGLGSVNNTTDLAKPVSTATQAALDLKVTTVGGSFRIHKPATTLPATGVLGDIAFVIPA